MTFRAYLGSLFPIGKPIKPPIEQPRELTIKLKLSGVDEAEAKIDRLKRKAAELRMGIASAAVMLDRMAEKLGKCQ